MKLAILGTGAWGTALAINLSSVHDVMLWGRDASLIAAISAARLNQRYLPGYPVPASVTLTHDLRTALLAADLALVAVPSASLRAILGQVVALRRDVAILWACKGVESGTGKLPHETAAEVLCSGAVCGVLSGPSFAQEIALGKPTALTLASTAPDFAGATARALHSGRLRVYSSDDVIGVELGGAMKNVMAIAAGISDGMALGDNARAALITRGLAEITRLGSRLGGKLETFMGLTGLGDLVLTCTGDLSRNRQVGLQLAQGACLDTILRRLGHIAEGVYTAREVARMAASLNVDMPITGAICKVLYDNVAAHAALKELLNRDPKPEFRR